MNTPFDDIEPKKPTLASKIRSSFLTGLVVIAPVGVTIWLIWTVIGWIDGFVLPLVPETELTAPFVDRNLHGIGVIFFLVFTVLVGWVAKGLIGRTLIRWAESLVDRTPVVRSIYSGIKQISETVFAQTERNFEKAVMIEYPRRGIWAIGFVSTEAKGEIKRHRSDDQLQSVFVPTTPNPTSGFLLYFPKKDVIELDMSVEDAAKLVISAGLVYPPDRNATSEDTEEPKDTAAQ